MIYKLGLNYIIPVIRTQLSHNRYYFYILLLLLPITRSSAQCSYTLNDILDKVMCNSLEYRLPKIQSEINRRTYEINMASLVLFVVQSTYSLKEQGEKSLDKLRIQKNFEFRNKP